MKRLTFLHASLAALLLSSTASILNAQTPTQYQKHSKASDPKFPYVWNPMADGKPTPGPITRTIFSPLDGLPLLTFTSNFPLRNSDGCSIVDYLKDPGSKAHADFFLTACLNHDANYAAPWTEIGWKDGRLLCEYILLQDMKQTIDRSSINSARKDAARIVANVWYNFLEPGVTRSSLGFVKTEPFDDGQRLNRNQGYQFSNIKKGGLLSVWNESGAYIMGVDVTYTATNGRRVSFSERQPIKKTIIVPLSIGARDIKITCYALGGKVIFENKYAEPTTRRWAIGGSSLFPSLRNNP